LLRSRRKLCERPRWGPSIGPVCSESLEAHSVHPRLEATPPKMGPLVALVAERVPALVQRDP